MDSADELEFDTLHVDLNVCTCTPKDALAQPTSGIILCNNKYPGQFCKHTPQHVCA